ncbi:TOG array regulator of axonemal microtubules protein 2 [Prunus avium]|uniref:TOG array regulator of axonemal microtubules protein 2 n=1 Tax=Prunus avium TaxID=42229 RepID=A0A6P5RT75_PRUAV|nr:TOG array regulator of axonemal microtubules protein 2 [Prunus avium]
MAMALRPIDNALPTTPERPKKQTKVPVSIQKQPEFGVNDENQAPLPAATIDATIDYISSENLKPISDPDFKILSLNEGLDSKDWVKVCESLNNVRRFALYHSALLVPTLEKVMVVMVKAMKNPRSALCKTSIMASFDIFRAFGDSLFDSATSAAFDQLLLQLLLKASQDKRFVCEEADRTLNTMVQSLTPLPLLQKLRAYASHANPRVRAKAAVSVSACVSKMGLEGMKDYGLVSMVKMAADLLNDRLPEAREAARGIVLSVYNAYTENEEEKQETWLNFCQSNLTPIHAQSMVKITSSQ